VHVVLSLVAGAVAWQLQERRLLEQAEERAQTVSSLARFLGSETVRSQMEELTGYRIRRLQSAVPTRPGTIQLREAGDLIEIDYRNQAYQDARRNLLWGTSAFVLLGVLAFGLVAWALSWTLARPLEALAASARSIGDGDFGSPVPQAGGGEIGTLARDLEAMRTRLRALDEANRQAERLATLGSFTAVIAHEVRNPLTAVRLTVQVLARKHGEDESLCTIMNELERLDLIVDELLAFSKGISVDLRDCSLRAVADDVLRLLRRQSEHAGVGLQVRGDDALVRADPDRLRQLLLNLVLNAIQAQHGGGEVRVILEPGGFRVEDDGPGLDTEMVDRAFEPFRSGRSEGTGLGLHIARAIAEAHDASLHYRPGESGGATFSLTGLPTAGALAEEDG